MSVKSAVFPGGLHPSLVGVVIATVLLAGAARAASPDTGNVHGWGGNGQGQLGVGDTDNRSNPTPTSRPLPKSVPLAGKVAAMAAGAEHTIALAPWSSDGVEGPQEPRGESCSLAPLPLCPPRLP